ncbi:MAG TPA: DUF72 domain-containing protein [Kofleriaceae bacterium]|nr:DUF72 domain-containing protein [Kofleriaceae bacterium]
MELYAGTSGFSYPEWRGPFYPADLPDAQLLAYYADRLRTVEINNTFYRMPRAEMLARWAERVPDGFRFVLKAPQRITHKSRLEGTADAVAYLWRTASSLGGRVGPLLFQLPPYQRADVERLRRFLGELPVGMQAAFEFRHASWNQPEVMDVLRDAGCALCAADSDPPAEPVPPERLPRGSTEDAAIEPHSEPDPGDSPMVATADFGYLRLRRASYTDAELDAWISRIRTEGRRWREVYVFFKHEDAGAAPAMAARMNARFAAAAPFARPGAETSPRWR